MPHPLVTQLYFTRSEWMRALVDVSPEDAAQQVGSMNSIAWMIGHLANQEQSYWVATQGKVIAPDLSQRVGSGQPHSAPPLDEMWATWREITQKADQFLNTLTTDQLATHLQRDGQPLRESIGTMLYRNIYHYWYHLGEAHAIRQMLGHENLPQFVGDMTNALYTPE